MQGVRTSDAACTRATGSQPQWFQPALSLQPFRSLQACLRVCPLPPPACATRSRWAATAALLLIAAALTTVVQPAQQRAALPCTRPCASQRVQVQQCQCCQAPAPCTPRHTLATLCPTCACRSLAATPLKSHLMTPRSSWRAGCRAGWTTCPPSACPSCPSSCRWYMYC